MDRSVIELPNKLSELAAMALDDVTELEQRPSEFTIDMEEAYLDPAGPNGTCVICAAGAVMVQRLGASPDHVLFPHSFEPRIHRALEAIDRLRDGSVGAAFVELRARVIHPSAMKSFDADYAAARELDRDMPRYSESTELWREEMQVLIDDLEEAGL